MAEDWQDNHSVKQQTIIDPKDFSIATINDEPPLFAEAATAVRLDENDSEEQQSMQFFAHADIYGEGTLHMEILRDLSSVESDDDAAMADAEDVGPGNKGGRAGGSLRSEGDVKGTHFVHNKRGVGALVWPHRCPSVCLC